MLPSRLLRFVLVGGFATGLQFVLLVLLVELAGRPPVPASVVSFMLSALANYLLNYRFTFRSQQPHADTLPRFVLVATLGVVINTGVFSAFLPLLPYVFAQVIATAATLASNFLLHHYWIYRRQAL